MKDGMEPGQHLKFRNTLTPASGFQSAQYRLIKFDKSVSGTLYLIDVTGKNVKQVYVNNSNEVQLNLQDIAAGIYGLTMNGIQLKQNRLQVIK